MQLDRVVVPAGFFNPARTFSLVRDDGGIYLIFTGRAMGPNMSGGAGAAGAIAGAILDKMADKRFVEIQAAEEKLRREGPASMKDTKYSHYMPASAIQAVEIKGGDPPHGWPVVVLRGDKKFKLHFGAYDRATVQQFFAPFMPK